jgi:hypothetical protein
VQWKIKMTDRLTKARNAIAAVFVTNNIAAPPTRSAYTELNITAYPIMQVRRVFGSWDRAMKLIVKHSALALNDAPTIANALVDQALDEGASLAYTFAANTFADAVGQTLIYSLVSAPAWVALDPATRAITGTAPAVTLETVDTVIVRATDNFGRFVDASFTVTVNNV